MTETSDAPTETRRAVPRSGALPEEGRAPSAADLRQMAIEDQKAGRLEAAFAGYRACLRLAPDDPGAWTNLGALLRKKGEHRLAVSCQRKAHRLAPSDHGILNNLGNALQDADLVDEALVVRREVLRLRPESADAHAMLAVSLRTLGRLEEAIETAEAGLVLHPEDGELKVQRAMALLTFGDYAAGFEAFAARWDTGELQRPPQAEPEWMGEPLRDRRILVLPEQGFGDTLLMARFLPRLKALGPEVTLAVKPPLMRLFAGIDGVDHVAETGGPKPAVDCVAHMMDLPRHLGATIEDLPPAPALRIPQDARERAARIVAPFENRFRVGVAWSGSVTYKANHKRSFGPRRFSGLADVPDVQLFSLYKGPLLEAFQRSADSALIVDAAADDRDFADAAALIEALDLVITVDTAVAHLAGTLGRPVWNLLAHAPFWLYGPEGERTPWHPSMRLFRQRTPGDWDAVFAEVEIALREEVARWARSGS